MEFFRTEKGVALGFAIFAATFGFIAVGDEISVQDPDLALVPVIAAIVGGIIGYAISRLNAPAKVDKKGNNSPF